MLIPLKVFKKFRDGNTPRLILWGQHYPDTKPEKDTTREENYKLVTLIYTDAKILNKILADWIQQHTKEIIAHNQLRFIPGMQGRFNTRKSINMTCHFNRMRIKIMIILIDAEKNLTIFNICS